MILKYLINREKRDYFIEEVNAPLVEKILILARRYPKPTHENVLHANSHLLLELKDDFSAYWDFGARQAVFDALFDLVIVKYEHSPNYRNPLDRVIMLLGTIGWKPFNPDRQMACRRNK